MRGRPAWLTYLVLALGVLLRLGLALAWPADAAYDDHYEPVRVIRTQHRLPDASDCWECYQPPLYYLVSAGVGAAAERVVPGAATRPEGVGRVALQAVSLVAGCATLVLCVLIFRRFAALARFEALALALVAFLPRHVYMSAMATNDAFTWLLATAAIHAALRAHAAAWNPRPTLIAAALAGGAVLSKGYGWVTVAALLGSAWLCLGRAPGIPTSGRRARPLLLMTLTALAVGIWPTVRNLYTFDRLHVDNFDLRDSPMRFQPPESRRALSLTSFRLPALLRHPWLHVSHADSFVTELYGRLWFDYEGFKTSLAPYAPWQRLWNRCAQAYPQWNRPRWDMLLHYAADEVPPRLRPVAWAGYLAGLPLTAAVIAGAALALRRLGRDFPLTLLLIHFVLAACVPLVQTLRVPHFSAMKAAYALSGVSTAPVLLALLLAVLPAGRGRKAAVAGLTLALAAIAAADFRFLYLMHQMHSGGPGS